MGEEAGWACPDLRGASIAALIPALGRAQFATIRLRLLKVAAQVPRARRPSPARAIYNVEAWNVALERVMRTLDFTPRLPEIKVPTLVIAGRHDWICSPDLSEEIARLTPDADLRVFERSSHSVRADEPRMLLDAIAGFLVHRR